MNGESPRRTLVERITSSLQRDSGLPFLQKVSKGARYALATALWDDSMSHVEDGVHFAVPRLDAPGVTDRNAIVMAGAVARLRAPQLLVRPVVNPHVIQMELGRLKFRAEKSRWRLWRCGSPNDS